MALQRTLKICFLWWSHQLHFLSKETGIWTQVYEIWIKFSKMGKFCIGLLPLIFNSAVFYYTSITHDCTPLTPLMEKVFLKHTCCEMLLGFNIFILYQDQISVSLKQSNRCTPFPLLVKVPWDLIKGVHFPFPFLVLYVNILPKSKSSFNTAFIKIWFLLQLASLHFVS